jgi:hypothetical protein
VPDAHRQHRRGPGAHRPGRGRRSDPSRADDCHETAGS